MKYYGCTKKKKNKTVFSKKKESENYIYKIFKQN
uniref:Uncharacterized protein n=1 Tax=Pleurostomum flabellatum TaxID=405751 RepID=A0A7T0M442_9EUKA|nr:hypothetical protein J6731_mgp20 [Pleurostomum flabellatum]QPL15645.1 hypothetical protein [Pleurostomum flabellatum]